MTPVTSIIVEAICPDCGGLYRGGSLGRSMARACGLVKAHVEKTGHVQAFARLTQETYYE